MAKHEVSLNITRPIPVGNVDIEVPVRRNGKAFGKVKISKGAIDWMQDWGEFAKFMAEYGRPICGRQEQDGLLPRLLEIRTGVQARACSSSDESP